MDAFQSIVSSNKTPHENFTTAGSQSVDNMLAQEIFALSFQERNDINEEMHGVKSLTPDESPEMIYNSLNQLEEKLKLIPSQDKKMYNLCKERYGSKTSDQEGGSCVNDADFRLRFLRSKLFDAEAAARVLVNYLDVAVDLYGEYVLERPIRMSDFTDEELQIFRRGNLQMLPYRDRSGRRIIVAVGGLALQFDSKLRFKMLTYLCWVACDDIETQLKGIVTIIWPVSDEVVTYLKNDDLDMTTMKRRVEGLPVRTCAIHVCLPPNSIFNALKSLFAMVFDKPRRSRLKFHIGRTTELQYIVQTYGIPVDHIPVTGTGNIKTQTLRAWIKVRLILEDPNRQQLAQTIIECPGSNDVLFRPSKMIKGHPGNIMFQSLIESYVEADMGITAASKKILSDILAVDGRILVWDKRGWWTNMTDEAQMLFKVSVSYRDHRKKNKGKAQVCDSSTFAFQRPNVKKRKLLEPDPGAVSSSGIKGSDHCDFLLNSGRTVAALVNYE